MKVITVLNIRMDICFIFACGFYPSTLLIIQK